MQHYQDYVDAGSRVSDMKKYFNCINMPLLNVPEDQLVLSIVPPPELHLLMGGVNVELEVIREVLMKKNLEEVFWG